MKQEETSGSLVFIFLTTTLLLAMPMTSEMSGCSYHLSTTVSNTSLITNSAALVHIRSLGTNKMHKCWLWCADSSWNKSECWWVRAIPSPWCSQQLQLQHRPHLQTYWPTLSSHSCIPQVSFKVGHPQIINLRFQFQTLCHLRWKWFWRWIQFLFANQMPEITRQKSGSVKIQREREMELKFNLQGSFWTPSLAQNSSQKWLQLCERRS